ncbi:MAG: hypothetical protein WKF82_05675 [Nocardioidaceae bacterium]
MPNGQLALAGRGDVALSVVGSVGEPLMSGPTVQFMNDRELGILPIAPSVLAQYGRGSLPLQGRQSVSLLDIAQIPDFE